MSGMLGGDAKPGRRRLVVKATDAAFDAAGVEKTGKMWVKGILIVMQSGYRDGSVMGENKQYVAGDGHRSSGQSQGQSSRPSGRKAQIQKRFLRKITVFSKKEEQPDATELMHRRHLLTK